MVKTSLQFKLSQQLTMTPQLQQAIRLLQLPVLDLQLQIQEALEANIMLDTEEPADTAETSADGDSLGDSLSDSMGETLEVQAAEETDWQDDQTVGPAESSHSGDRPDQDFPDHQGQTLRDHLLWQVEMERFAPRAAAIATALIDAINEDGYLVEPLAEVRATLAPDIDAPIEEIEAVLLQLQQLDPAGVGARNVSECLSLQLDQLADDTPGLATARRIAAEHLELLADQQYTTLRRRLQASPEELEAAVALVRGCHPRPGSVIQAAAPEYRVPDVFVRKVDRRWVVELNAASFPRLTVNQTYAGLLGRHGEYEALRGQLQEARWLIRSLEIRNETLLKVASCIISRQQAFLEHGEEHMRPMVLKDVAEEVGMHESTISRVTMNKYMHTPRGVFEFRHFFSSQVGGDGGQAQSATAVRAKIRKLIAAEDAGKPLSDSKLAEMLDDDGVQVARRTVAKYREAMGIPTASERKRGNRNGRE